MEVEDARAIDALVKKLREATDGEQLGHVAHAAAVLLAECYCEAFHPDEHSDENRAEFLEETQGKIESVIEQMLVNATSSTQRH